MKRIVFPAIIAVLLAACSPPDVMDSGNGADKAASQSLCQQDSGDVDTPECPKEKK